MSLSERKWILKTAEYICLADILVCAYLAFQSKQDPEFASSIALFSHLNFLLVFAMFVLGIALCSEFAHANNINQGKESEEEGGLSFKEFAFLLQWAPLPIRYVHVIAGGVLGYIIIYIGSIEWSSGQPFTQRHAMGFMMYDILFLLFPYAFLASASRMTGGFSENRISS